METIHCVKGNTYTFAFDSSQSHLRYVVPMRCGEKLDYTVSWDTAAKVRVICQSPGGDVLFDRVNLRKQKFIAESHECAMDGMYSLYLLPLMIPNQKFQGQLAFTKKGYHYSWCWPVFFLIDCSSSMDAQAMANAQKGLAAVTSDLRCSPETLEMAAVTCIAFDSDAIALAESVELMDFELPLLNSNPFAAGDLAVALRALMASCDNTVHLKKSGWTKTDRKPYLFMISNFLCPSEWEETLLRQVRSRFECVALLTSEQADVVKAKALAETVISSTVELQSGVFSSFFRTHSSGPIRVSEDEEPATEEFLPLPPTHPSIVP